MTDQEKLSVPLTPANAANNATAVRATMIIAVINGKGEIIPNGGTSKDGNLQIIGTTRPLYEAEVWDGQDYLGTVHPDGDGNFNATLDDQQNGQHSYLIRSMSGEESTPWVVIVDVVKAPVIEAIFEPGGQLISDGQRTFYNELNFIGQGIPGRIVELVNNGKVVQLLNIDSSGHWSAKVTGLQTGTQRFTARDPNGLESGPWWIEVNKPVALSIKFVLGQEQFQLIENQGVTTDTSVTITGTGIPNERGWIVDYHQNLVEFAVDQHGIYSATVENLAVNHVHTLRCKSDSGRLSAPWAIRVVSSKT